MKSFLSRIFNILMAVVVLTSSTGFGLVEHSCTMRGKKTYSITKSDSCVGDKKSTSNQTCPNQTTLKKAPCCKDEDKYENVEYSSSISQLVAKFVQSAVDFVVSGVVYCFKMLVGALFSVLSTFVAYAPPSSSGREILVFVQSFLL